MPTFVASALLCVLSSTMVPAAVAGAGAPTTAKIDALMRAQVSGKVVPGAAIAIAKDGRLIFSRAYGVRNLQSKAPMLLTTPQPIGSITKQFTAALILLLQQEGKLSIDDRLSKYFPAYKYGKQITLRQMLNMTSGISDNDPAIYTDMLTKPVGPSTIMANLNKLPLSYRPGSRMAYTNTNYNFLGRIVEKVSGKPYLTFVRERIFAPLGMKSSGALDQPPAGMATGYAHDKPGQPFERRPEMGIDFSFGTGHLVSTTLDLLKWDAGLLGGRVLNAASLRTMFTVPGGGVTTIKETDRRFPALKYVSDGGPTVYAMGWMRPNPYTRWHGGHTFLFESTNVVFSDGYTVSIIGNVRDAGYFDPENLAARIHNMLNPSLHVPPLTAVVRAASPANDTSENP